MSIKERYDNLKFFENKFGKKYILRRVLAKAGLNKETKDETIYSFWLNKQGMEPRQRPNKFIEIKDGICFIFRKNVIVHPSFYDIAKQNMSQNDIIKILYTDEDCYNGKVKRHFRPYFKPDYSPELLLNFPYLGGAIAVRKDYLKKSTVSIEEIKKAIECTPEGDLAWCDLLLTLAAGIKDEFSEVCHISSVLFSNLCEYKPRVGRMKAFYRIKTDCGEVISKHLAEKGRKAKVTKSREQGFYRIRYEDLPNPPLVSIIIPSKDHIDELDTIITSIIEDNVYTNYEIIVIENNSEEEATFEYYEKLTSQKWDKDIDCLEGKLSGGQRVAIVHWKQGFSYAAINNYGAEFAKGSRLLFLNNDTELIDDEAIRELVMCLELDGVSAAGSMLYYEDDTIQHGGVVYKIGGFAANVMTNHGDRDEDLFPYVVTLHEVSGCTAACLMVSREVWDEVGGFDEKLAVALNDVDLCLKIRATGAKILFDPYSKLHHYESKSRGYENTPEKVERFNREIAYFKSKWSELIEKGDPYYNVNQTLNDPDYSLRIYS